jgi:hypothetical protein
MLSSKLYRKGAIKSEHNMYPVSPSLTINGLGTERVPHQALLEVTWYKWCMVWLILSTIIAPRFDELRFLYDFVAVPNTVFLGTSIASVTHNGNIKKIAVAATSRHHRAAWSRPRRVPVYPFGMSEHGRLINRMVIFGSNKYTIR